MSAGVQVIVLAKRPVAGRVKTRLCPPYRPEQAAALAEAALADTLDAVARTAAVRRVVALGDPDTDGRIAERARVRGDARPGGLGEPGAGGGWGAPPGFAVVRQRGGGLDARIAGAFADVYAGCAVPMLLIGMDTPQVTPGLLAAAGAALATSDAVLGPAADGGFWLLGLRRPDPGLLLGVPMSTPGTGAAQHARLRAAGLRVALAPTLRDVDTAADADEVAAAVPGSAFAAAHAEAGLAVTG
ncbi:MAG TPA: DUF2064 domain-containing protein [Streptosporangiaceae bacterium]